MKAFPVVLLISALCMGIVSSLICYKCENAKFHKECRDHVRCSDFDKFCVTLIKQPSGQDVSISKWCSMECPEFNTVTKGGKTESLSSDCCTSDYCNSGGPSSVKTSYAVVITATLASFFYIFRTGL